MKNLYKIEDELYIISDKEKSSYCIKECPMAGLTIDRCDCPIQGGCSNKVGTVILTTNNLLIEDGVQPIDDEFLEWFVKNPSCEEVEVIKSSYNGTKSIDKYWDGEYKIVTPIEKPRYEELETLEDVIYQSIGLAANEQGIINQALATSNVMKSLQKRMYSEEDKEKTFKAGRSYEELIQSQKQDFDWEGEIDYKPKSFKNWLKQFKKKS